MRYLVPTFVCLHALECVPDSLCDLLYAYLQDTKKAKPGEQGHEEGSEVDLAAKEKEKQEEKINALQVIANTI